MLKLLLVCAGSAFGGGARYLIAQAALRHFGSTFPVGTLAVNLIGSFLISALMQLGLSAAILSPEARLFLTTGVLGGLTTYSAFNHESLEFLRTRAFELALLNVAGTLFGCLLAGTLGTLVGRWLFSWPGDVH
jgi:CrcB protein